MRRMTTTINYSRALPLAQGIRFEIEAQPSGLSPGLGPGER